MKIIFLDFDGVLVLEADFRKAQRRCVEQLNRITNATGAKIVVSSTWRLLHGDCKDLLKLWGVTGEVIGHTPTEPTSKGGIIEVHRSRGGEIQHWILENGFAGDFVVIDDEITSFLPDRQVGTDFRHGLTEERADLAIAILNNVA